jgi:hypothetical protein
LRLALNKKKMSTLTIDELRLAVAFHREALAVHHEALAKAETALRDLEELPPETRPKTKEVMRERILKLETRRAYKYGWKKAIERGLVENVQRILDESADFLCDAAAPENSAEFVAAATERFGKKGSLQRQEFSLLVIRYLKSKGSFWRERGQFDDFEDTAGGCDEVTECAAIYLIENPEWKDAAAG